ncbi:MAG: efflux RND transporter periplasmic adaptor subunit [Deltaproteobacteria bacterium]|nr:efflux RND transporter periplasmic adaptor subunit [Deltaproteobacteria bacterium]
MDEQFEIPGPGRAPKKRLRVGRLVLALLIIAAVGAAVGYGVGLFRSGGGSADKVAKADEKYTCGMHPWIISDKPGECPICGMKLTKISETPSPEEAAKQMSEAEDFFSDKPAASKSPRKLLFYRNPMDPTITSPVPKKDEMGMDYVPVYSDEAAGAASGAVPEGLATIRVGAEALRLAGVQTAQATRERLSRSVRTVGTVVPDETRVRHVHTKVEGWVEKLHINFMGQVVRRGQPILSIYAPELLASQEEFLRARETAAKFEQSPSPDVRRLGEELLRSARRRLELFDVPGSFISNLARTGKVQRAVTLSAPVDGYVTGKEIFEGQQVEPGMELFNVTDLSRVWIEADLYEYEASSVKVGQPATVSLAYDPGVKLQGKVAYVLPFLSPESRTLKVRFEFPNPKLALKPQMFADVSLSLDSAEGVTIPDSALIDTGVRQIVFVEVSTGTFEPREVKLGVRGEGRAQVVSGVRPGEKVVTKANFLLDSESRLRAALNKMTGATQPQKPKVDQSGGAGRGAPPAAPGGAGHAGHGG